MAAQGRWDFKLMFALGWLFHAAAAPGHGKDPTEQLQQQIDAAKERGLVRLKSLQTNDGMWPSAKSEKDLGATALAAWTLAALGVPANDPGLSKAIAIIRSNVTRESKNFNLAISRLFHP
jgi:hypothetical protein